MERLNGFNVYGYRLTVKVANQKNGSIGSRTNDGIGIKTNKVGGGANMDAAEGSVQGAKVKKVRGHVQDEDLWELQKCLVGEMATVCSVRAIADRLEKWGLNGIKVGRMGGKTFLLSFEDEDLYIMMEDLEWSYLKEIFYSVEVAIVSSGDVDITTPRACGDVRDMEIDMDKNEEESFRDFFPEISQEKRPKIVKRSLSDSDLATRWNAATNEARKVLKLGKRLGMGIIGDEQEAVKEIARLEFGEAD
ncbi:hypothetical protein GQ457_14G024220 [Hibiscus cannabinus]